MNILTSFCFVQVQMEHYLWRGEGTGSALVVRLLVQYIVDEQEREELQQHLFAFWHWLGFR